MRIALLASILIGASAQIDKRCGLPPNHASLPEFAKEELQAIWKDYVPGAPCKKEIELTDEILKVLDEFGSDFETDTATSSSAVVSGNDSSGSASITDVETTTEEVTTPEPPIERQHFVPPATLKPRRTKTSTWAPRIDGASTPNYRRIASSTVKHNDDYYDYHDPAPTQGKVAKSLQKIGSPAFKDYGDVELLRDRKRKNLDDNIGNFFRTTTRKPVEYHSRKATTGAGAPRQFHDYDFKLNDYSDDFNVHFDTPDAPFLKNVPPKVREEFERLWNNDDIPSESLRAEKVHLLAVSLLNGEQLEIYNNWATNRKKALKAREDEMQNLTPKARAALRRIARDDGQDQMRLAPSIKRELIGFARRLETRRLRRSRARRS
ncbi:jud-4 [Pristionchus pacificus]|uniref:Jud-4 n=1 Tax=Pristionchus pacificus TaxID=54126 RepID=A0A2A6BCE8_PRIPA|nr:jud-4 [Pristionchus pacificus]|eukprot:PDM63548.1 jud-4 [Pristionchus pacificus]